MKSIKNFFRNWWRMHKDLKLGFMLLLSFIVALVFTGAFFMHPKGGLTFGFLFSLRAGLSLISALAIASFLVYLGNLPNYLKKLVTSKGSMLLRIRKGKVVEVREDSMYPVEGTEIRRFSIFEGNTRAEGVLLGDYFLQFKLIFFHALHRPTFGFTILLATDGYYELDFWQQVYDKIIIPCEKKNIFLFSLFVYLVWIADWYWTVASKESYQKSMSSDERGMFIRNRVIELLQNNASTQSESWRFPSFIKSVDVKCSLEFESDTQLKWN